MDVCDFVNAVESYLGTPYHHQGRLPGTGIDCVGVPIVALQSGGIDVPEGRIEYDRVPRELESNLDRVLDRVPWDERRVGDLVLFWYSTRRRGQHVGVIVDRSDDVDYIVHSHSSRNCVIRERISTFWAPRIIRAYRHPELVY